MPNLSTTRNYQDGTDLSEAQLDAAFDSIESWANSTRLNSDNIQSGGIAESNLASGSVTETKLGASAVTSVKVADGAITGAKLAAAIVDDSTIQLASNTLKVKDAGITQAKKAVRAAANPASAGGIAISSSSGAFSSTSTSYVDVTNLSVTLTSLGNPIRIEVVGDGSGNVSKFGGFRNAAGFTMNVALLRGATTISEFEFSLAAATQASLVVPPSSVAHLDPVGAGTYTYKIQIKNATGFAMDSMYASYLKLVAYEL